VDEKIKDLIEQGTNPTIGLLAHTQIGEIHIRLTAKAREKGKAEALNSSLEAKVRERLDEFIFGTDEETYEGILGNLLEKSGLKLGVVETAFGSSIGQTLKTMAGNRAFFTAAILNPVMAKKIFDLPESFFPEGSLVTAEGAKALAEGVCRFTGAELGLSLTGQVGKEKGQDHLAFIALAHPGGTEGIEQRWPMAMRFIENRMTKMALAQVRKYLLRG
jgi:nicotinamide-nucleotide amidase